MLSRPLWPSFASILPTFSRTVVLSLRAVCPPSDIPTIEEGVNSRRIGAFNSRFPCQHGFRKNFRPLSLASSKDSTGNREFVLKRWAAAKCVKSLLLHDNSAARTKDLDRQRKVGWKTSLAVQPTKPVRLRPQQEFKSPCQAKAIDLSLAYGVDFNSENKKSKKSFLFSPDCSEPGGFWEWGGLEHVVSYMRA